MEKNIGVKVFEFSDKQIEMLDSVLFYFEEYLINQNLLEDDMSSESLLSDSIGYTVDHQDFRNLVSKIDQMKTTINLLGHQPKENN